jgi:adenosylcobinamide kinase/adenosylcobinamide-phosphate guanylyltransferase
MANNILITGGARSGKSRFAEEQIRRFGQSLCYLATAQALDAEMHTRIQRHRLRRGNGWETIEEPLMIPQTLARIDGIYSAILLDCVTLWLSNLLLSHSETDPDVEEQLLGHVHRLTSTLRGMATPVVLVTNEVGQGIVPDNALARLYRDVAGQANQILAASCDSVYVAISGIPLKLK